MDFCKRIKIFGFYLYISTCRLKRRGSRDNLCRNRHKKLLRHRARLYDRQGGCCAVCGRVLGENDFEIHHVIAVSDRPDLVAKLSNLRLLCHECHRRVHKMV